jgi:hypothetical protein
MTLRHTIVAAAILATGCGGTTSTPSEGAVVAELSSRGNAVAVSVDAGDVFVLLLDASGSPHVAIDRVRGSVVSTMTLAPTDWSDYSAGSLVGLDPAQTAVVSRDKGYFLGQFGVTVVTLDGSSSRTLYAPSASGGGGHAFNELGAFGVDEGNVYVCESDFSTNSTNLGRFDADGTWTVLFTGSPPMHGESCFGGAVVADANAVYWSTSQAIRAYDKRSGAVRTVVDLGGLSLPPPLLALDGGSLAWFGELDGAFHVASAAATTPDVPAVLGATTVARIAWDSPAPFSMLATGGRLYWLTPFDLQRLPLQGGAADALARRPQANGLYMGLATDGKNLYFTDAHGAGDAGGPLTLCSAPL